MSMVAVKKSYRRYNENNLVTFSTNFTSNLFQSTVLFSSPPVSKVNMETAIADYEKAFKVFYSQRSSYNAGETFNRRKDLIDLLDGQIGYVENTAPDEASVKALALEPAATEPRKTPVPDQPEGEGTKMSKFPQSVVVFCKPVKLVNSAAKVSYYVYETNAEGSVEQSLLAAGTNSRKLEFGGLTTGKVYFFYIRAKSTTGFGPPSKPVRWVGQ